MPYSYELALPSGWVWSQRPDPAYTHLDDAIGIVRRERQDEETRVADFRRLYEWSRDNEILTQPNGSRQVSVYTFHGIIDSLDRWWGAITCERGVTHLTMHERTCRCDPDSEVQLVCNFMGCTGVIQHTFPDGEARCHRHMLFCNHAGCEEPLPHMVGEETRYHCSEHILLWTCDGCRIEFECDIDFASANIVEVEHRETILRLCENCAYNHVCTPCGRYEERGVRAVQGSREPLCRECSRTFQEDRLEQFDDNDTMGVDEWDLENHSHRPIRTCSIELETTGGGVTIATALRREGLTNYGEILGYHASDQNYGDRGFCHVERDSSLGNNGGEIVFDRINLDDTADLERMHRAVTVIREYVKAGEVEINVRCGVHYHIDAHGFGIGHTRNLVLVTNYLEDVIYRLSAARYRRHRGREYAIPTDKGPFPTRRDFGVRFFSRNEHHSALNLTNYWTAISRNCSCGATVVGEHETCTCNLGKCTFEFRFFNGTANFRKLHAYGALCQSLVAFARSSPDLEEQEFPPLEYESTLHAGFPDTLKDAWDHRLRWMLSNLYFSDRERESLRYTVDTSALNELGEDRIEDIFSTRYERIEVPTQEVRRVPRTPFRNRNRTVPRFQPLDVDIDLDREYPEDDY